MKARKCFLAILFSTITFCNYAQTVQWANSNSNGSGGINYTYGVTSDALGNAYMTGIFTGTVNFGTYSLTSAGGNDVYISKTNAAGTVKWAKRFGNANDDFGQAISSDASSNIYIAGTFTGTVAFDSYTLTSGNATDPKMFICKIDSTGTVLWAQAYTPTPTLFNCFTGMCIDVLGNIYVIGNFMAQIDFGGFVTVFSSSVAFNDAFIAKMDNNGNPLWARSIGGLSANDNAKGIATDNTGIYFTGDFANTVTFGTTTLTSTGGSDAFVTKISSTGTFMWAKNFGTLGTDGGTTIAANNSSNIYIGGQYTAPFTIGASTFTAGNTYIAKIDATGSVIWANKFESDQTASVNGMVTDGFGNIYSTGWFKGTTSFGTNTVVAAVLTCSNSSVNDIFFSKLDASGNFVWVKQMRCSFPLNSNVGTSMSYYSGNIYSTGYFGGNFWATIDAFTLFSANTTSYLVKIGASDVGVNENIKELNVFVYPNPSNDKLFIELKEKGEEVHYSFTDVSGKELIHKKRITSNETIDVSRYAKGAYFLQLETNKQSAVRKIIIE